MPMKNPPHPGRLVLEDCIKPLGLTIAKAAKGLGLSRTSLSQLINEHKGVSTEIAVRLAKGLGGSPESWLRMQYAYDLAQVRTPGGAVAGFIYFTI